MKILIIIFLVLLSTQVWASSTRYARTDGGTSSQCDGLTDHALAGASGTNCAVNHPNWLFPPRGESSSVAAATGDKVIIESGSYRIGCQNSTNCRDSSVNLTNSGFCAAAYPYDCYMGTVPDNVEIHGCTTTGCATGADRPELWGAGRINQMINISNSSGVTIDDVEVTDHSDAMRVAPSGDCTSGDATALCAADGILMTGSSNATIKNVYVHGLERDGIRGGSQSDNQFIGSRFKVEFNYSNFNFDTCGDHSCPEPSGHTITIQGDSPSTPIQVNWGGCPEDHTNIGTPMTHGCCNSGACYGDGLGTAQTSGTWIVKNASFKYNASDGLDLKYCVDSGCSTTVDHVYAEGNAGNQLKVAGSLIVTDTILSGDCDYFSGKSFTDNSGDFLNCRAGGDAIAADFSSGSTARFRGLTVVNVRGNDAFTIRAADVLGNCTGSNTIDTQNSIFQSSTSAGWMNVDSSCTSAVATQTTSDISGFGTNPSGTGNVFTSPLLSGGVNGNTPDVYLTSSSPAINIADESASGQDSTDFNDSSRGSNWDAGALQFPTNYKYRGKISFSGKVAL